MTWVWVVLFLVMFTPYIVDCPQKAQASAKPKVAVELPREYWVKNYGRYCEEHKEYHGDGSCVHASLRMLLNWQGQTEIADNWLKTYPGGGEDLDSIKKKCDPYIRYAVGKDYEWVKKACATHRGCIIGMSVEKDFLFFDWTIGYHCVVVAYADDHQVALIDPNTSEKPRWVSKEWFMKVWNKGGHWALTPVYTPSPPIPPGYTEKIDTKIIFFHATWCKPCHQMEPIVTDVNKTHPGSIISVDVDQSNADEQWGVTAYPTFIVLKDGKEVARYVGVIPKSVLEDHLK